MEKLLDRLVKQTIEIQFRAQVQEHSPQTDCGAIHEHELPRHRHRTLALERLMHAKRFAAAVFAGRHAVSNCAHAVIEERRINKSRPNIERVDQFAGKPAEAPGFVGVHDEVVVAVQQTVIKVDHALDEFRRKNADATVIQEIDPGRLSVTRQIRCSCRDAGRRE